MGTSKSHYFFSLLIVISLFACKASKNDATTLVDAEGESLSSADIIMVNGKLKETLETYFYIFSKMKREDVNTKEMKRKEVFEYFKSEETPVFLVLYNKEGKKYYDEPTSISEYLHYLNDTQQAPHYIENIVLNEEQTKIVKLEMASK